MKERVLNMVKTIIKEETEKLVYGRGISDYAIYQKVVGRIEGLEYIKKIYQKLESEDEQAITGTIS